MERGSASVGGKLAVRAIPRCNANVSRSKPGDHPALLPTRANGPEFPSGREQRHCLGIKEEVKMTIESRNGVKVALIPV